MHTVLIVDDSRTFQLVIQNALSDHFQIVGRGRNGMEGFELYAKLKPDLVILDITMPICSGKECLEKILKYDPSARVIMVSGIDDVVTIKECMNFGAKNYINKESILNTDSSSPLLQAALEVVQENRRALVNE